MAKNKDPAVLFYTSDFLVGVQGLTMEERGQYITLLCLQHQQGHLSDKQITLAVGNPSADVIDKFDVDADGLYYHHRMEKEIEKRENFIAKQHSNGAKGGRPQKPKQNPNKTHGLTHGVTQTITQTKPKQNPTENENITKDIINTKAIDESNSLPIFPFSDNNNNTVLPISGAGAHLKKRFDAKDVHNVEFFKYLCEILHDFDIKRNPDDFIAYNEARGWRGIGGESVLDNLERYIERWDKYETERMKAFTTIGKE